MLHTEKLLDNLTGRMTAKQLSEKTGLTVRDTVVGLCTLEEQGKVTQRVDAEGAPVRRWRLA
jgi:predicted Rossmann fold nucleotide-binding protein DprA/Smf involved in DNA uptake